LLALPAALWQGSPSGRLNYGDCFAYALAKTRRLALLFQSDDFSRTDIEGVAL
jgi:ribonuclease VapC